MTDSKIKHDWKLDEILHLFSLPFNDLIFKAQVIHRENFDQNEIQTSALLSIKTGGCVEDCRYCSQSSSSKAGVKAEKLLDLATVLEHANEAKNGGATRFCMGAAWRSLKDRDMIKIEEMIAGVKALGLETCMTLGMLTEEQAVGLKEAGLDYYNHNIDTSEEFYPSIITTRTFLDRIETLEYVRRAGMSSCSGGIIGMGESIDDRASMLMTLANLTEHPGSVPINMLIPMEGTPLGELQTTFNSSLLEEVADSSPPPLRGRVREGGSLKKENDLSLNPTPSPSLKGRGISHSTPLENAETVDTFDFIRTIAVARILMPKSYVRLSAGRESMSDEMQSLCFLAGANSIFIGERLLTTENISDGKDKRLFKKLGMKLC